jgi:hypothetical protein
VHLALRENFAVFLPPAELLGGTATGEAPNHSFTGVVSREVAGEVSGEALGEL